MKHVLLRLGCLAFLGAAALSLTLPSPRVEHVRVVCLDVSSSCHTELADYPVYLQAVQQDASPDEILLLVLFARQAQPLPRFELSSDQLPLALGAGETALSAALDRAAALLQSRSGASGRILLISDGRATTGDLSGSLRRLARARIPVDTFSVPRSRRFDVALLDFHGPHRAAPRQTIPLSLTLQSSHSARVRLRLRRNALAVPLSVEPATMSLEVALDAGSPRSVDLRAKTSDSPLDVFEVEAEPLDRQDDLPQNNRASWCLLRRDSAPLLLLSPAPGQSALGSTALRALPSFSVSPRSQLPEAQLAFYELVVIENCPFSSLGPLAASQLSSFVRAGGGLLMLGREGAFAPGGYAGTAIEEVLPVHLLPPEGLALVLVLDRSSSMAQLLPSGETKFHHATQAARSVLDLLRPEERVGWLAFSQQVTEELPLRPRSEAEGAVDLLKKITPKGGTRFLPPLQRLSELLRSEEAEQRIAFFITDGELSENLDSDRQRADWARAWQALSEAGVSVRFLLTSVGAAATRLETLLREVPIASVRRLDRLEDLAQTLRDELLQERRLLSKPQEPPLLSSTPLFLEGMAELPFLQRAHRLTAKPRASVMARFREGTPLLAGWRVERGRAASFATGLSGDWAEAWAAWDSLTDFVGRTLLWLARDRTSEHTQLDLHLEGDHLLGTLQVRSQEETSDLPASMQVCLTTPQGEELPLRLSQTGPHEAEFRAEVRGPGAYIASVRPVAGGGDLAREAIWVEAGREFRALGPDEFALQRIRHATGGEVWLPGSRLPPPLEASSPPVEVPVPPWLLAALGLVCLFAEVYLDARAKARGAGGGERRALGVQESEPRP